MTLDLQQMGKQAKAAARHLARSSTAQRNQLLQAIADGLMANHDDILAANALDVEEGRANGLSPAILDRLSLKGRLQGIADDVRAVAALPDPVGEIFDAWTRPDGLAIHKLRVPIGVLGVIYEARPNVTIDVAALALKTANGAILRGGKETLRSNLKLIEVVRGALAACGFPPDVIQFISDPDRRYVSELLRLHQYVDMIIPRGGAALHQLCRDNSSIPVITGGLGICHLYIDPTADLTAALDVIYNGRVQRPSVCNSLDTILVHEQIAATFLPSVVEHLRASGVTFRLDPLAQTILPPDGMTLLPAGEADFDTEWMALILGIRVVSGIDSAIDHIIAHSTAHSDGILTRDEQAAAHFIAEVDSAAVFVNASTRFNDGGEFGLGAEVAVSTQKLHARGPMGLRELTTYKWVVQGNNHIRGK